MGTDLLDAVEDIEELLPVLVPAPGLTRKPRMMGWSDTQIGWLVRDILRSVVGMLRARALYNNGRQVLAGRPEGRGGVQACVCLKLAR